MMRSAVWGWAGVVGVVCVAAGCGRSGVPMAGEDGGGATPEPTGTAQPTPTVAGMFGDGRDGPLDLPSGDLVLNVCSEVRTAGPLAITLETAGLAGPGDVLLVLQVQGGAPATSGDPSPVSAGVATVTGRWELVVVESVDGTFVVPVTPLLNGYASDPGRRAQACRVPQHTNVSVASDARLLASPWDGHVGGIVAFLANGAVTVNGAVDASGFGFRGGAASLVSTNGGGSGVTLLDTSDSDGGEKGESLDVSTWTLNGRGNVHSGAGGGNKRSSGGGGGGSGGEGGTGGFENGSTDPLTRGQGGALYDAMLADRLFFGGGGGGGHRGSDAEAGRGGAGGGIVLVLAQSIGGSGVLVADGAKGDDGLDPDGGSGAGGGGAGGSLLLSIGSGSIKLETSGGDGGDALSPDNACGPGGGGGGGAMRIHASGTLDTKVDAGKHGTAQATNDGHGSTDGADGRITDF